LIYDDLSGCDITHKPVSVLTLETYVVTTHANEALW